MRLVLSVAVAPGDVPADHRVLLLVSAVVGAVEGEVAQRLKLRLDPVQPRGVCRYVGQLDIVGCAQSPIRLSLFVERCGLTLSMTMAIRTLGG
jgi:hypothetical protein